VACHRSKLKAMHNCAIAMSRCGIGINVPGGNTFGLRLDIGR